MKLICLNVFGGKLSEPLLQFIKEHARDAHVFCFQEVLSSPTNTRTENGFHSNILFDISCALPHFSEYFEVSDKGVPYFGSDPDIEFGNAIFVRKSLAVKSAGSEVIHPGKTPIVDSTMDVTRKVQFIQLENISIFNLQGLAKWPKTDIPERIDQSRRLQDVLGRFTGRKILCGDFNLRPDTESLRMLESRMKNLIKEFGIERTRPETMEDKTPDYMIVSKDVKVNNFEVPEVEISDHLPLILEFE